MHPSSEVSVLRRSQLMLSTEYVEPSCEVGSLLAEVWQNVVNIDIVGIHDDFFEIGGDSLGASVIAGDIEIRFGCKFSPSQIVEFSTIAGQMAYIEKQKQAKVAIPSNFTVCHAEGKKAPLFFVHGARGFSMYNTQFLEGLDKDRPVIFIEAVGLDGKEPGLESVEAMAEHYLNSMRQVAPNGNWLLAANCAGGLISMEICKQAEQAGEAVARLILVDPMAQLFGKADKGCLIRWRKKIGQIILPTRIRSYLHFFRFFLQNREIATFERSLDANSKKQALIEARIQMRDLDSQSSLVPSNVPYRADAMRQVLEDLMIAFKKYKPSQWNGLAYVLITESRKSGLENLKSVLPNARCRIVPFNHQGLFEEGLPEILKFLDDALSPDKEHTF